MSRGVLATISVFVIGIIITIAGFFLLNIEQVTLNFYALGFLLFSQVVSLFVVITVIRPKEKNTGVLYVSGLMSSIWIYEVAVILSILFIHLFDDSQGQFVFLQIVINALLFVTIISISNVSRHLNSKNAESQKKLMEEDNKEYRRGGF